MKSLLGIILLAGLMSCNQSDKKSAAVQDSSTKDSASHVTVVLKDNKLSAIYGSYIELKNVLVSSDSSSVKEKALSLYKTLDGFEGCQTTAVTAKKMSDEKTLAAQRKDFTDISSDLVALFKHSDLNGGTIYIQHCPMANNGNGGDWLSSEKEIMNPYYGDEMLNCGSVIEEIKSK